MSITRLTGMATGLDTDNMIKQMMKPYQMKLDKVRQDRELIQWRQELYRDIVKDINNFSRNYFDVLKTDTYMLSKSNFSPYSVEGVSGNNVNISATSTARAGAYKMKIDFMAESPEIKGSSIINKVTAGNSEFGIKIDNTNNSFSIKLQDGTLQNISINVNEANGFNRYSDATQLADAINNSLRDIKVAPANTEILGDKVKAVAKDGNIQLMTLNKVEKNNEFTFSYGGGNYKITLAEGNYTADELASQINSKLIGLKSIDTPSIDFPVDKKVTANTTNSGTVFSINGTDITDLKQNNSIVNIGTIDLNAISIDSSSGTNLSMGAIKNTLVVSKEIISGFNDTINVRIGSTIKTVTLPTDTTPSTLQQKINDGLSGTGISVTIDNGKVSFNSTSKEQISVYGNGVSTIGAYNNFEINMKSDTKMSNIVSGAVEFKINDVLFKFDFTKNSDESATGAKDKSIADIVSDIKSKTGIDMAYSELTKTFNISSTSTGRSESISIQDISGEFFKSTLGFVSATDSGSDAQFTLTDPLNNNSTYTKSTNAFVIDGINFNINSIPSGEISFNLLSNPDTTVNKIKDFVTKYNEMIEKIDIKLSEKKQYKYLPLTDEQKKEMSEDEIKKWEEKAKEGLLRRDSDLTNMLYSLRSALFQPVDGVNITLKEMGMDTSSDYTQKGKIILDETKLRECIRNKGDLVSDFFTKQSKNRPTYTIVSSERQVRNSEEGIFQRINDILKDYTRTTSGKGSLILKAGIKGDYTEATNTLSEYLKQKDKIIQDMVTKLYDKENRLYKQFAQLEKAMNQMNAQSSWLTQQLGGGNR